MSGITLDEIVDLQITDGTDTLAINADGSINATVTATDLDIRDLSASQDNVAISDGTDTLAIAADGSIAVTDNGGSLTVDATDFDIRDLAHTQDSVDLGDGTSTWDLQTLDSAFNGTGVSVGVAGVRQDAGGSPVSADGDAHPFVFNNSGELKTAANLSSSVSDDEPYTEMPIAIGARGVSGALTALSATNDKYDILGDLYRRTWVNTSYNVASKNTAATVGTTAAEVLGTPMAGRRRVVIQNNDNNNVYLGFDGTVTTANGLRIPKKSSATFEFGEDINVFLISDAAAQDVRLFEMG